MLQPVLLHDMRRGKTARQATPARWDANLAVAVPSRMGPRNDVIFPENAKNPKNSAWCFSGTNRPISDRLAD